MRRFFLAERPPSPPPGGGREKRAPFKRRALLRALGRGRLQVQERNERVERAMGYPVCNCDSIEQLTMSVLMMPDSANFSGNVHGGELLRLLDQVAYACATRYCGYYVVTLSVDRVLFKEPIRVGELVTFKASINRTGNTSMEVGIRVEAQDVKTKAVRHTNSCYFTMVALDDKGKPTRVPQLKLDTPLKRIRAAAAEKRKEIRSRHDVENESCSNDAEDPQAPQA